ncbi:GNVR domain-containing protein [Klebsiella pneumoniae]|uniref:GNVR domain-containing protein n=1 Tax=Klebsiella pneumoniae TaxID=573 RepID=UPI001E34992F|nr:GNVR domain-containing protein [Klebsiella pneumoniae]
MLLNRQQELNIAFKIKWQFGNVRIIDLCTQLKPVKTENSAVIVLVLGFITPCLITCISHEEE